MKKNASGFTITEVIITLGISAVIFAMGVPVLVSDYFREEINAERDNLVSILKKAEILALANKNQTPQGVRIASDEYTVFEGGSYASRNAAADELYSKSSNAAITGASEVVFSPIFGTTTAAMITLSGNQRILTISINNEGMIDY